MDLLNDLGDEVTEHGIEELLEHLDQTSISQRAKGDAFERLIKAFLLTEPLYSEQLESVSMWGEWPYREGIDAGIDLIAHTRTDEYWAIQCKFYSANHVLAKSEIDSFFTASGRGFLVEGTRCTFTKRLIFTTTNHWSREAERAIQDQTIPVTRIGRADLADSSIDWSRFDWEEPTNLVRKPGKHLRTHQVEAIEAVIEGFRDHDRGQLIMACGTGKTFTSLRLAEQLTPMDGLVLVLAPSIALIGQSLREWSAEASDPMVAFAVCSDTKVGKEIEDIRTTDLAYVTTTDPAVLARDVTGFPLPHRKVIFSTYQSIQTVIDAQRIGIGSFDLVICDEAHRTTGITLATEDDSTFTRVHDATKLHASKRLYMTATPRIYTDKAKGKAGEKEAALYSMDDEATFGPEFYRLGFGAAVELGLLSDYKVLIVAEDEERMARLANEYNAVTLDEVSAIDTEFAAKVVGSWRALSMDEIIEIDGDGKTVLFEGAKPMRRAVSFARSIRGSKAVADTFAHFEKLYQNEAPFTERKLVSLDARHVDGTMNALSRQEDLSWLRGDVAGGDCRILTNARCLSEGIDVPALDAVIFFDTRESMVDVVQSVGRVMRKAEGKDYGYIILPVCMPLSEITDFDHYIDSDKRFKSIWKVIKALRAHDESLVDEGEFRRKVKAVTGRDADYTDVNQLDLPLGTRTPLSELTNALYATLPKKLGDRDYWRDWAKNVATIAQRLQTRVKVALETPQGQEVLTEFLASLAETINPAIDEPQAIEMLVQHILTRPIFDAFFGESGFADANPVSRSLQTVVELLDELSIASETESLTKFYEEVDRRVANAKSDKSRQDLIRNLYDTFFANAFPSMAERLGIVYTPIEIVDYILRSVNDVLREHFGVSLGDQDVKILDPFTGTGTFIARMLQLGLIGSEQLEHKYRKELFASEIVLLAYYIAAVNIEAAYHELTQEYVPFDGIVLTDTFQMNEGHGHLDDWMLTDNHDRVQRQRQQTIRVIVGNPPYSALQGSANDNNANVVYPVLDQRIRETYVERCTATLKNSLYDSYIRAIRWASDRIGDEGIIGFVTNGYFLDSVAGDGMRMSLQDEFSHLYILNLRGDQRTAGDISRREGGKVFGSGSRARVAITIMVKDPTHTGPVEIHYHDIGDYLSREEKLSRLEEAQSIAGTTWQLIEPNKHGDWLSTRDPEFDRYLEMGNKKEKGAQTIFSIYSAGMKSNRDAWAYNFSKDAVAANMARMIDVYNEEVDTYQHRITGLAEGNRPKVEDVVELNPRRISWDGTLLTEAAKGRRYDFDDSKVIPSLYRPFTKQYCYFDRAFNNSVYKLYELFPTPHHENLVIAVSGIGARIPFSALAIDQLPALDLIEKSQCFPLYYYERTGATRRKDAQDTMFEPSTETDQDGYIRRDTITDWALEQFRTHYDDDTITKHQIFDYIYAVLHLPEYRERFGEDLKKRLPRIPFVNDFTKTARVGLKLIELHVSYEELEPYPLSILKRESMNPGEVYRVEKPHFGKRDGAVDKGRLIYNDYVEITGIPETVSDYVVNGRNLIEWVIDRYQIRENSASGIINDPNEHSEEPTYIVDLIGKLVRVSVETVSLVEQLKEVAIESTQAKR